MIKKDIYKLVIGVIALLSCLNELNAQINKSTLNKIYECQKKEYGNNIDMQIFDASRRRAFELDSLIFINKNDTVYFIESNIDQFIEGIIWTKAKCVRYTSVALRDLKFAIYELDWLPLPYMQHLVSTWNIERIREMEKGEVGITAVVEENDFYATRVILNGKNVKIDTFRFKEFINDELDREQLTRDFIRYKN